MTFVKRGDIEPGTVVGTLRIGYFGPWELREETIYKEDPRYKVSYTSMREQMDHEYAVVVIEDGVNPKVVVTEKGERLEKTNWNRYITELDIAYQAARDMEDAIYFLQRDREHAKWINEIISVREAAEILDVSDESVRRWVKMGILTGRKKGRAIRVRRGEVFELAEKRFAHDDNEEQGKSLQAV